MEGSPGEDRPRNQAQLDSPSYRLAALDKDFLLGGSMRGTRFLLEFEKADRALRNFASSSTVALSPARACGGMGLNHSPAGMRRRETREATQIDGCQGSSPVRRGA